MISWLDGRLAPLDGEARPARARRPARVVLETIPGIGPLLGLTIAAGIGVPASLASRRRASSLATPGWRRRSSSPDRAPGPDRCRGGGLKALRWAAVEAQRAWRETNPWHQLYRDVARRQGTANAGKAAVARKVLIATWHVLSREQPFKPSRPRGGADPVPASSHFHLAA
ncbi:MAG: transposase [Solirubrobacteraceae bacterium]